jgi:TctA family transporter
VEGVLGPGAANNSTRGGDLIPTIAFGIPGSGSMALLLGAMLIVGLNPGPEMLKSRLDVTFSMVWVLILSNIIVCALCFLILNHLQRSRLSRFAADTFSYVPRFHRLFYGQQRS